MLFCNRFFSGLFLRRVMPAACIVLMLAGCVSARAPLAEAARPAVADAVIAHKAHKGARKGGIAGDGRLPRAIAANDIRKDALAAGIPAETVDAALAGLKADPAVSAAAHRQPEFAVPVWDYLDGAISDSRIAEGQKQLAGLKDLLGKIDAAYGVPAPVVVAIWGIESSFGASAGPKSSGRDVIRTLVTLETERGLRGKTAHEELLSAMKLLADKTVTRDQLVGSWAGAMGQVQFMPSTYAAYAVDFEGHGKRDIWTSVPDALASAANYMAKSGWKSDRPWGYEVVLPKGFDPKLVRETKTSAEWQALGVARSHKLLFGKGDMALKLLLPAGIKGPAFLVTDNFEVLRVYNKSDNYALAVGLLADRIAGTPDLEAMWPRDEPALTQDELAEIQAGLNAAGLHAGNTDGRFGGTSVIALRDYEASHGMVADGWPNQDVLAYLRKAGADMAGLDAAKAGQPAAAAPAPVAR